MKANETNKILVPVLLFIIILLLLVILVIVFKNDKEEYKTSNDNGSFINDSYDDKDEDDKIDTQVNYIGKEKALMIALNDSKLKQSDIHDLDIDFDYKYQQDVYEVSFNYQNYEYEYYINASSGKIIHHFKEID